MALAGYGGQVITDGVTGIEIFHWTMSDQANSLDASVFNAAGRVSTIQGLKQATGDIECRWNAITDTMQVNLYNAYLNSTTVVLQLYTSSASTYYYQATARIMSVDLETPVDNLISQKFHYEVQGAVTLNTSAPAALTFTSVPANNATAVATSTTVAFTFNKAIFPATATLNNIYLMNATGALVTCTLALSAGNTVATLTPTGALTAANTYIAVVSKNVLATDGGALAATGTVKFST